MIRSALITGVTGQDGWYLSRMLMDEGVAVTGLLLPKEAELGLGDKLAALGVRMVVGDLADGDSLRRAVAESQPDEVYNLAAQSSVAVSFSDPAGTMNITGTGVIRLLEAVRLEAPSAHVFQAASAEIFGQAEQCPQTEDTPIRPVSPYGVAKAAALWAVRVWREAYGMHANCGILYNHESPFRAPGFVTRKITMGAARIAEGLQRRLALGNLDARRDWGSARDYVRAMAMMLRHDAPGDYIVATGTTHTVRDFCDAAFRAAGLDWQDHVDIDPKFFRPADPMVLTGDASRAKEVLGWQPGVPFDEMVREMVEHDLDLARKEAGKAG